MAQVPSPNPLRFAADFDRYVDEVSVAYMRLWGLDYLDEGDPRLWDGRYNLHWGSWTGGTESRTRSRQLSALRWRSGGMTTEYRRRVIEKLETDDTYPGGVLLARRGVDAGRSGYRVVSTWAFAPVEKGSEYWAGIAFVPRGEDGTSPVIVFAFGPQEGQRGDDFFDEIRRIASHELTHVFDVKSRLPVLRKPRDPRNRLDDPIEVEAVGAEIAHYLTAHLDHAAPEKLEQAKVALVRFVASGDVFRQLFFNVEALTPRAKFMLADVAARRRLGRHLLRRIDDYVQPLGTFYAPGRFSPLRKTMTQFGLAPYQAVAERKKVERKKEEAEREAERQKKEAERQKEEAEREAERQKKEAERQKETERQKREANERELTARLRLIRRLSDVHWSDKDEQRAALVVLSHEERVAFACDCASHVLAAFDGRIRPDVMRRLRDALAEVRRSAALAPGSGSARVADMAASDVARELVVARTPEEAAAAAADTLVVNTRYVADAVGYAAMAEVSGSGSYTEADKKKLIYAGCYAVSAARAAAFADSSRTAEENAWQVRRLVALVEESLARFR